MYILPKLILANSYEALQDFHKIETKILFETEEKSNDVENITIDQLDHQNRLCIIGEPGCGKTTLLVEKKKDLEKNGHNIYQYNLKDYDYNNLLNKISKIPTNSSSIFVLLDALDEVESYRFNSGINFIKKISQEYPLITFWFTCREYYVKGNNESFKTLTNFKYLEVYPFDKQKIEEFIKSRITDKDIQSKLINSISYRENTAILNLVKIPRYLNAFCDYYESSKNTDLQAIKKSNFFEFAIYKDLEKEENIEKIPNGMQITKRVLEKLALIMEIHRINHLTMDELFSILDELESNLSLSILGSYNVNEFATRLLSKQGERLEFQNTEFQEYLAAKELLRMAVPEQFLYDIAVDSQFHHIYDSWYDVLCYIIESKPAFILHLLNLIRKLNTRMADDRILNLILRADFDQLNNNDKTEIFNTYYEYFQKHDIFLSHTSYLSKLTSCYTNDCSNYFQEKVSEDSNGNRYYTRITNQACLIVELYKEGLLSDELRNKWINIFCDLTANENNLIQQCGFYSLGQIKEGQKLVEICQSTYHSSSKEIQIYQISALSLAEVDDDISISLFIEGLNSGYPEAISACINIKRQAAILKVYKTIIDLENGLNKFFDSKHHVIIYSFVAEQLKSCLNSDLKEQTRSIIKSFFSYFAQSHYLNYGESELCKKLLELLHDYSINMIDDFLLMHQRSYYLQEHLDWFLPFINEETLEKIKEYANKHNFIPDGDQFCLEILQSIINKEEYKDLYEKYRSVYPDYYQSWENPSFNRKELKKKEWVQQLEKIDKNNIDACINFFDHFSSFKDISEEKHKSKVIDCLYLIMDNIDLDKLTVKNTSDTSYSISNYNFMHLDKYIHALINLGQIEKVQKRYRALCIHFLPAATSLGSFSQDLGIYQEIIGDLTEEEKKELVSWCLSRKDDYLSLNIQSFIAATEKYKLLGLIPLIEKYIESSTTDIFKSQLAFNLLAQEFVGKDETYFVDIFNRKRPEDVEFDSLEEYANRHLISRFNNKEAGLWRIKYLKTNVISVNHKVGSHSISQREAELYTPRFCNCFYENPSDIYRDNFIDLVSFALSLCNKNSHFDYSQYLLTISFTYFKSLKSAKDIEDIGNLIYNYPLEHAHRIAIPLLRDSELFFVNQDNQEGISYSIDKYNFCKKYRYAQIHNERSLFNLVSRAVDNVISVIENEGFYSIAQFAVNNLSEDFIQKTLKILLKDELIKLGLRQVDIDREVTLLDNKRTDLLVRYGFIGPVMMELKLLHNPEVNNELEMRTYKQKLIQYIKATNSEHSYYLIFDIRHIENQKSSFEKMKDFYSDINGLTVRLINCECSYKALPKTSISNINNKAKRKRKK